MVSDQASQPLWAIIPAGGSGSRMAADRPKQYLKVAGEPILAHTFRSLLKLDQLEGVIVATAEDDVYWAQILQRYQPLWTQQCEIHRVPGGATRAQSVFNALSFAKQRLADTQPVLIHDAARPCVDLDSLNRLLERAGCESGAILALPSVDTLKFSHSTQGENPSIAKTIDRSTVWRAQTPQLFTLGKLHQAIANAFENSWEITDEASAMELAGFQPKLILGDSRNIKVTTPDDLKMVEFFLHQQQS